MVNNYKKQPIPIPINPPTAGMYGHQPVDEQSSYNMEPLVTASAHDIAGTNFYHLPENANAAYQNNLKGTFEKVWVRQTVAQKLAAVNEEAKKYDCELFLTDGYRSVACQQSLWQTICDEARDMGKVGEEVTVYAEQYVSNPTRFNKHDSTTWPSHSTGGAVDVTLRCLKTGEYLSMGVEVDNNSHFAHTAAYEKLAKEGKLGAEEHEALENRRLLFHLMHGQGFVNYAYEFWHYDWGTQMAMTNGPQWQQPVPQKAYYGYCEPPKEEKE